VVETRNVGETPQDVGQEEELPKLQKEQEEPQRQPQQQQQEERPL
jgi:hypothetical protein